MLGIRLSNGVKAAKTLSEYSLMKEKDSQTDHSDLLFIGQEIIRAGCNSSTSLTWGFREGFLSQVMAGLSLEG